MLCYTEQHNTIAITNAGTTQEHLERSKAPYATVNVARETNIKAFVAEDIAIPALRATGVDIAFESLVQGDGTVGDASAEVAVNIESMRAREVDAVFVVGDALVAVNAFIDEGYFPTLFFTRSPTIQSSTPCAAAL